MKIHAVQTGSVRIKTAQVEGRGRGLARRLRVFTDRDWTDWLPTYAWVIEHPEGVIVVDTGQGMHLVTSARSFHPFHRWEVTFRIEREQEIGPQLRALGIGLQDVKKVVLTHLHVDHDGGLSHFPHTEILVARGELRNARGWMGRARGYLPQRWPSWFSPTPLDLVGGDFGAFPASFRLTKAGDVIALATAGHTPHHLSVAVMDGGITYFLAGDTSYNERLMLAGKVDGVSASDEAAERTLAAIRLFARDHPTVYLPTHDLDSATRLASRAIVVTPAIRPATQ